MKGSDTEDPNQAAKDVCLFEVNFNKLCSFPLDVLDSLPYVGNLQFRRECNLPVEPFRIKGQTSLPESAHGWNGNDSTRSSCGVPRTEVTREGLLSAPNSASLGIARSAIR